MRISKVLRYSISGPPSYRYPIIPGEECAEVRGVVESVTLQLPDQLTLIVGGKEYSLGSWEKDCPLRIDVGEEVVLHLKGGSVVGGQIVARDEAIFRFLLPKSDYDLYLFSDMKQPK